MTFKELGLLPQIQKALDELGFEKPTEIQEKSIPLLKEGSADFHGQAQTGTGKTLAFGIPLLEQLDLNSKSVQSLIVAPTRELVLQISQSLEEAAKFMPEVFITTIYGGVPIQDQMKRLKKGVHIVVGTPGRLNDHLKRKTLRLNELKTLVLDEADIMLEMGFKEEVDEILRYCPKKRNIWLFSATVKEGISQIMQEHMKNTISISVSKKQIGSSSTKQYFAVVSHRDRIPALCRFIDSVKDFYGFVFCQTKLLTAEVAEKLTKRGYDAMPLHGDMSQQQRNLVIKRFKNKEFPVLVATDVAARGIDVSDITHVINYSLPEDHESYVHRVGRTGRAGKEGISITFISKSELRSIPRLQKKFSVKINPIDVPDLEAILNVRVDQAAEYMKEVSESIKDSSYAQRLYELVKNYSDKQLMEAVVSFLDDKFFSYLAKDKNINFLPANKIKMDQSYEPALEFYITVGSDDGLTKKDILNFIEKQGSVSKDSIEKLKLLKRRTYLMTTKKIAQSLMPKLSGKTVARRRVKVFLADELSHRKGGKRRREHKTMYSSYSPIMN